ncbi:MAG: hypothetical protein ACD_20C00022G0010 [uncultured bacterium]|nr:MAG: hypothetical protein ACD_20C00022G0010 [uncultured bacterium]HBH18278.1 hypothetical protein [Cyanobacteria bacterium UBA9579]
MINSDHSDNNSYNINTKADVELIPADKTRGVLDSFRKSVLDDPILHKQINILDKKVQVEKQDYESIMGSEESLDTLVSSIVPADLLNPIRIVAKIKLRGIMEQKADLIDFIAKDPDNESIKRQLSQLTAKQKIYDDILNNLE